jgi:hypothetical protein
MFLEFKVVGSLSIDFWIKGYGWEYPYSGVRDARGCCCLRSAWR